MHSRISNEGTHEESRDVVPHMAFDADSRMRNGRRKQSTMSTGSTITNIISPEFRNGNGNENGNLPSIECIPSREPSIPTPVPNIEINLVAPEKAHQNEDDTHTSNDDYYIDDGNSAHAAGSHISVHHAKIPNSVQFQDTRKQSRVSQDCSINNIFSPIVYSSTLLPVMIDPLEENRRTSIAVLQEKVNKFNAYQRRKTVNEKLKGWMAPAENAANLKLFGGVRAVQEEQHRSLKAGWIIHPFSNLRYHWDLFMMIILAINMFVLPLNIAFLDTTEAWIVFEICLFAIFATDIILNFRTGFKEDSKGYRMNIILDTKKIVTRYAKTWLVVDLISSLPLDLITLGFTGSNGGDVSLGVKSATNAMKFLRLMKLLSLLKLLRMTRFIRIVSKYEDFYRVTASIVRYIKLVMCMLLVAHWNGCLAFLVPLLQEFPPKCWVSLNRLVDAHWTEQYGWALFKALSHMLCIGYGRFIPQLLSEAVLTIFSMITGATFYALFIAHSMAYLQQNDSARRQFQEKFKQIEEYMCYRDLPISTRERITDYYEHKYAQKRLFDEHEILSEISPPLRNDIVNHNCRDLVEKVPFLKEGGNDFITLIINKLNFDVYLPGDTVIKEGAFGNEMYFIRYGIVDVLSENHVVASLSEGEYFGEITMLTGARRVASVKAITVCNLFILHKDNLYAALNEFPEMRVLMEHIALDRLMKLKTKHPESLSDNSQLAAGHLEDRMNTEMDDNYSRRGTIASNASQGTTIYINEAMGINNNTNNSNSTIQFASQTFNSSTTRTPSGAIKSCMKNRRLSDPTHKVREDATVPTVAQGSTYRHAAVNSGVRRHSHEPQRTFQHSPIPTQQGRSKSLGSHIVPSTHQPGVANCGCPLCDQRPFVT